MTSHILLAVEILTVIIGISGMILYHTRKPSSLPGALNQLLWIGPSIRHTYRVRYGPVFRMVLRNHHVIVITSAEAIRNALFADHHLLSAHIEHYENAYIACNDPSLYQRLYATNAHRIFPILDHRLSRRAVDGITPGFAAQVFHTLKLLSNTHSVSLKQSLTEPLYVAASTILFGSRFSPDTYHDFVTFNQSIPARLCRRPFWFLPSSRARKRLLNHISQYLDEAGSTAADDKLAASFIDAFREHNIPLKESAPVILLLMVSHYGNMFNTVLWLMTSLLADPVAFSAVRNEIDKGVREVFGGIQPFLAEASPTSLNSESFVLLNSAILETLRMNAVLTSLRIAQRDFDLRDDEGTIPIYKDDYIMLDVRAAHRCENSYPDGDKFIFDRFVSKEYESDITSAAGKPFFALGAGKHLCK
ncbi:hypothetical protein ID866_9454, partial [Astraeus odoratus]